MTDLTDHLHSVHACVCPQVMRNIFQACHNVYKPDSEPPISDNCALRLMKFNPRLFEVKLSQRMVNVTYVEDVDFFVVTEGEAARWVNFRSGERYIDQSPLSTIRFRCRAPSDFLSAIADRITFKVTFGPYPPPHCYNG